MTIPFDPDWTIAPAATLDDWMQENGLSVDVLAVACVGRENKQYAVTLIREVLDRKPLLKSHADCLAMGTFIPARFWLALEQNYRAGLAKGLTDTTHRIERLEWRCLVVSEQLVDLTEAAAYVIAQLLIAEVCRNFDDGDGGYSSGNGWFPDA